VTRTTAFTLSVTLALSVASPITTPDSGSVSGASAPSTPISSGNTYYVATNGNDSNSGTFSNPFRTIAKGISALRGGEILYIRGGTYSERIPWPVGGTQSAPTTISNYQTEVVTIRPSGEGAMIGAVTTANRWTVFNGLILDGINADELSSGFSICCGIDSRITFQNGEVKNFPGGGLDVFAHNNRILNTKIHHNAVATSYGPPHGMYISGYGNLFERLEVYNNGYYGMHIYNSGDNSVSDNIVRYSSIHHNGLQCIGYGCGGYGIIVSTGSNNQVYSNLIYSNGSGGFGGGIQVNYRCLNCKIYSNTVFNNYGYGIDIDTSSTGVVVRNNISTNNRSAAINNQASGTIISNNMTSDPRFVNPALNDFRLQSGSGAIDTGFDLSTIGITTDLLGVNRPQGSGFDLGAYEYVP
jgi:parallel beta-helix repeat protein